MVTTRWCFFFNDTATTKIYTLSLHDALPISRADVRRGDVLLTLVHKGQHVELKSVEQDRKSTRLNSSHVEISYAVFCLKKKKINENNIVHTTASQDDCHSSLRLMVLNIVQHT